MAGVPNSSDQFLAHYGVKGMKWGRRKSQSNNASPSAMKTHTPFAKNPNQAPPRVKGATDVRPKHVNRMTDVELRNRINRIQMETQYSQLVNPKTEAPKSGLQKAGDNFEKGHKAVKKVIDIGKTAQAIHKLVTSPLVKDIAKLLQDDD